MLKLPIDSRFGGIQIVKKNVFSIIGINPVTCVLYPISIKLKNQNNRCDNIKQYIPKFQNDEYTVSGSIPMVKK